MIIYDDEISPELDSAIETNHNLMKMLKKERDVIYSMLKVIMFDTGTYDISFSIKKDIDNIKDYRLKIIVPDNNPDEYTLSLVFPD